MITPADVYNEVKRSNRQVLVAKMKLFPPGGRTVVSRDDQIGTTMEEYLVPQAIEAMNRDDQRVLITLLPNEHIVRNRYFAKLLKAGASWKFLGESDAWIDLFPVELNVQDLEIGSYVIQGIATGDVGADYIVLAQDSLIIEVTQ